MPARAPSRDWRRAHRPLFVVEIVEVGGAHVVVRAARPAGSSRLCIAVYGMRPMRSATGSPSARSGCRSAVAVLGVAGVDGDHGDQRPAVNRFGQERHRRRGGEVDQRRQLVGQRARPLAVEAQNLRGVLARVEDRSRQYRRAHPVEPELERGDDAEVAAAAAQRPEQVRVLGLAGMDQAAVRGDDVRGDRGCRRSGRALRISQPIPPPSVKPAMPVVETSPPVTASPNACVSWSSVAPRGAGLRAWRSALAGSTRTPFIGDRSITRPPSQVEKPGMLWPPPRTATSRSSLRANSTAPDHVGHAGAARRSAPGARSCAPFQTARASS